jgi:PAS domain S-box-containing protein
MINLARIGAATPTTGTGLELEAISAVVVGGTPLTGGYGSIPKTVMGAVALVTLSSGLTIVGIPPSWDAVVRGVLIIAAIGIALDRRKIGIVQGDLDGQRPENRHWHQEIRARFFGIENTRLYRDLEQREAKIRRLVDANIIGIYTWDFEGRIIEVNDAFLQMLGYEREDLAAGQIRWTDLTPLEWRDQDERLARQLKVTGHLPPFEKEFFRKDGSRLPLLMGVETFEEGGKDGVAFVLDLTERKRAEQAVREREAKIHRLVDANIIGIGITKGDGEVIEANDAYLKIVGYDREDLVAGRLRWRDLTPPDWQHRSAQALAEVESTGTFQPFEKEFYRKDGSRVPVLIGGAAFDEERHQLVAFVLDLTERKHAEEAARRSEKELRDVIDTIPAMAWTAQPDGTNDFMNYYWRDFTGTPSKDASGVGWQGSFHPADIGTHVEKWRASLATGRPFENEARLQRARDGEFRWFLHRAVPLRDENGNILKWYGTSTEIDDRKRAEQALREREAKIRGLFEANIIAIFIGDIEGQVIEANDAFFQMLGYDREDLASGRVHRTKITPPEWRDRDARTRAELETLGRIQPFEKEYWRKDGSRVPVLVGAAVFQPDRVVAFVLDLTERKRAEQALRESEEQWKAVFENNPTMYFMVDTGGAIVSVNPLGAEQLGFTVDELIGRPVQDLFHVEDRKAVTRNTAICFERRGQTMSWEARKIRKNGEVLWVREVAKVMLIKDRPVALIVCEDVTERKRVSDALREVEIELAHANRVATLGHLTASIAHEVNQPIATARNNAAAALRFLSADPPDLEEVREALGCVVNDTHRAGDIIHGIRAHIEKVPPRNACFDINEAINELIALARTEVVEKGVRLRIRLAEGLFPVQGDKVQLQQVFLNLILNAVEAMNSIDGGPRELSISTERRGADEVLVAVRDSGPGIDPEHLERVFDSFYTTKPAGLGLGLSICRSIIDSHGGRLWADANESEGAVFQFTVPAANKDP